MKNGRLPSVFFAVTHARCRLFEACYKRKSPCRKYFLTNWLKIRKVIKQVEKLVPVVKRTLEPHFWVIASLIGFVSRAIFLSSYLERKKDERERKKTFA